MCSILVFCSLSLCFSKKNEFQELYRAREAVVDQRTSISNGRGKDREGERERDGEREGERQNEEKFIECKHMRINAMTPIDRERERERDRGE